jgi:histidinol-phosphate/aromatic aminotransferase/cobyric acid decarboxylase-like protein
VPIACMRAIAVACVANGGRLVVDRTYRAFLRAPDLLDPDLPNSLPPVLQLHSLTKSHALAGLRLGYLIGAGDEIARVAVYQPTWSVSSAAQAAGLAALEDAAFLPRTLPQLWAASDALRDGLERLGLAVWRASLPFLQVRTDDGAATRAALLARGCVVRDCASFGLPKYVRVAPRRADENEEFLRVWGEVVGDKMTR